MESVERSGIGLSWGARWSTALALLAASACAPENGDATQRLVLIPTDTPAESQILAWRHDDATAPTVEIVAEGASDEGTQVEAQGSESEEGTHYRATATGLTPDTEYRYRVNNDGETGDWHHFTTAASTPDPFTFLYFGDAQTDISTEAAPVIRAGLDAEPDAELILHAGDMVDDANSDSQWGEWFDAFGDRLAETNQILTVGNHEYDDVLSSYWRTQFPSAGNGPDGGADLSDTVSYTDYQGVRFVSLNSNYREAPDDDTEVAWLETQEEWLDSVLADNPHDWSVVTFHHPLFPNRPDRDNEPLREAWLNTLEEHDVDLVLQGHDHSYGRGTMTSGAEDPDERTGPVYVVAVTGPKTYEAGTQLWDDNGAESDVQRTDTQTFQAITVDGDTMEFSAHTAEGELVDEFRIVREDGGARIVEAE